MAIDASSTSHMLKVVYMTGILSKIKSISEKITTKAMTALLILLVVLKKKQTCFTPSKQMAYWAWQEATEVTKTCSDQSST
jgi:hypothetical protein